MKNGFLAESIITFYRFWHGRCRLKGAGFLLRHASQYVGGLQRYPLRVPDVGTITVDFRDYAGRLWIQHLIGDRLAAFDLEDSLCRAVANIMKDGEVFWDVGASVGMVTAAIAKTFPKTRIFAFEPNPFLFQSLEALFDGRTNIRIFPFALSNQDGNVLLTIPKAKSVGASIRGLDYVLQTSSLTLDDVVQVEARAVKGDSLIDGELRLPAPHVLKIDVEGYEVAVLKGFADTIALHHPIIFFEHLYLTDKEVAELVPPGYSLHSVAIDTGSITTGFDRSVGHNSVLLPGNN